MLPNENMVEERIGRSSANENEFDSSIKLGDLFQSNVSSWCSGSAFIEVFYGKK